MSGRKLLSKGVALWALASCNARPDGAGGSSRRRRCCHDHALSRQCRLGTEFPLDTRLQDQIFGRQKKRRSERRTNVVARFRQQGKTPVLKRRRRLPECKRKGRRYSPSFLPSFRKSSHPSEHYGSDGTDAVVIHRLSTDVAVPGQAGTCFWHLLQKLDPASSCPYGPGEPCPRQNPSWSDPQPPTTPHLCTWLSASS